VPDPRRGSQLGSVSRPDDIAFRSPLRELAAARRRFGYRRLHLLLDREGPHINHERLRRLYREECLPGQTARRPQASARHQSAAVAEHHLFHGGKRNKFSFPPGTPEVQSSRSQILHLPKQGWRCAHAPLLCAPHRPSGLEVFVVESAAEHGLA
jgi:transposase InsO family protein